MRAIAFSLLLLVALPACSSNDEPTSTTDAGPGGGPVSGAADTHCTVPTKKVVTVDPAACTPPTTDAGSDAEADAATEDAMEESAPTMFGSKGDDDDCKYHLEWSITPTHQGEDETVTVKVTKLADGSAATGATPSLEVFLDESHLAPKLGDKAVEVSPGTYQIKGVRFDASGQWTIRFHLYQDCFDGETSPHGHAAFYVSVP